MNPSFADVLFFVTAATYVMASVLFFAFLSRSERVKDQGRLAPRLVGVASVLHLAHILISSYVFHVCPVEGVHFAMSVVSAFACLVYTITRTRFRIDVVGAFVAPFALTFLLASRFVGWGRTDDSAARMRDAIRPVHVTVNLVGIAFFLLAAVAAGAYLLQEKRLKGKRPLGILGRLPPLDALDAAEHRFLLAGFPMLTIGIVTGTLWAQKVEAGSPADLMRAGFGYVSWLLFALVLLLRALAGWRGRRAAYGTIIGFAFTLLVLVLYITREVSAAAGAVAGLR
jgi:ABC-type uncharacterized transport system permease subunit